ncbi:MAG: cytochrome c, partial [Chloroflexi bacterium]|nr:cytochrome c [Chloroflexota bacterium]
PTPTPSPTPPWPTPSPTPSPTPPVIDGAALYAANNCAFCHGASRQGASFGPPITAAALAGKTVAQVASTIANGKGTMPAWSGIMTMEQISALAAWLKTTP